MNANSLLRAASLLAIMPILGIAQVRQNADPVVLKHWAAPLYWQPRAAGAGSQALDPNPLIFVAMTPCRVVDTRASQTFPAPFGAPSISAGSARTFPLQSSTTCSVPAAAQAYSFSVTVVPSGPTGFITAYPTGQTLPLAATLVWAQGSLTSNAAIVPGGTNGSIDVYANAATDLVIDINGYYTQASDSLQNTALGQLTLNDNTTGLHNTAFGFGALASNTTGGGNTANGNVALASVTTGNADTAVGDRALQSMTGGNDNTAVGFGTLVQLQTGSGNTALGIAAGQNLTVGTDNIYIASSGASTDNLTTRIGTNQNRFFAAGISGVTTGISNAIPVMIDSNGQLGTASSSRRYKEDIHDMGEASRAILDLRPVTFRYQKPFEDGSKPMQYGLIAEEVAEVFPDLVARSSDGQIEAVKYQVLDSLLLNEVQRQQAEIASLKGQIKELQEQSSKRGKRRFPGSK